MGLLNKPIRERAFWEDSIEEESDKDLTQPLTFENIAIVGFDGNSVWDELYSRGALFNGEYWIRKLSTADANNREIIISFNLQKKVFVRTFSVEFEGQFANLRVDFILEKLENGQWATLQEELNLTGINNFFVLSGQGFYASEVRVRITTEWLATPNNGDIFLRNLLASI